MQIKLINLSNLLVYTNKNLLKAKNDIPKTIRKSFGPIFLQGKKQRNKQNRINTAKTQTKSYCILSKSDKWITRPKIFLQQATKLLVCQNKQGKQ